MTMKKLFKDIINKIEIECMKHSILMREELIRPEMLKDFDCGEEGLNNYFHDAYGSTMEGRENTFMVTFRGKIVALYTIKGAIIMENWDTHAEFDTSSACELVNFALRKEYRGHKLGEKIFQKVIWKRLRRIERAGMPIRYITLYALPKPELLKYYEEELGFKRLPLMYEAFLEEKIKPRYDRGCIFMYKSFH